MIVFDLKCGAEGHVFEAWFGSSSGYEDQRRRGLVCCPLCGDDEVDKAVMAPRVSAKSNQAFATPNQKEGIVSDPEGMKTMLAAMAAVQKQLLERSTYVGDRFADAARAIHLGEVPSHSIYGKATLVEAESLAAEGIEVAPLPFPVIEPSQEN